MFIFLKPNLERRKSRERLTLEHEIFDAEKELAQTAARLEYLRKRHKSLKPKPEHVVGVRTVA